MTDGTSFGIDFGTTNTRVALYDGTYVRMVQFNTTAGLLVQYPTLISYESGQPVSYGPEAREQKVGLLSQPMKWLLNRDDPVEVEGGTREPTEIVADFLRNMRAVAEDNLRDRKLTEAAVTIPVHFPPKARRRLEKAFNDAGIKVTHFFFEPIAAIYGNLLAEPVSGPVAVFDWGGGSLDIASVQIRDGIALTRNIDGWHRGGSNFDELICSQAVDDFLSVTPIEDMTAEDILRRTDNGKRLRLRAEQAKEQLSRSQEVLISYHRFHGQAHLEYQLRRHHFEELIDHDITGGIARLVQVLAASGVSPKVLARLYLSGGTCNVPNVRNRLTQEVTGKITSTLRLPSHLKGRVATAGLDDIGSATAIGAALLAVHGAKPVFASSIGIRLADSNGDRFYPVFERDKPVSFVPEQLQLFVTDASSGVARLLICDQDESGLAPGGRLLRVVPVPIEKDENWVNVSFTMERHLALRVDAAGKKNLRIDTFGKIANWPHEPVWIQQLNLGFPIPQFASSSTEQ